MLNACRVLSGSSGACMSAFPARAATTPSVIGQWAPPNSYSKYRYVQRLYLEQYYHVLAVCNLVRTVATSGNEGARINIYPIHHKLAYRYIASAVSPCRLPPWQQRPGVGRRTAPGYIKRPRNPSQARHGSWHCEHCHAASRAPHVLHRHRVCMFTSSFY